MPNVFLSTLLSTEEGAKLVLSEEIENNCRVVYRLTETGDAIFDGYWDRNKEYPDNYVIVPLRSVYGGVEDFAKDTVFANVIKSSDDPRPDGYSSWISLIRATTDNDCTVCCTDKYVYGEYGKKYDGREICDTIIDGGHVIRGMETMEVEPGRSVYLLPICRSHNTHTPHTRAISYMKTAKAVKAVKLDGFLNSRVIQNAFEQLTH